jgi:hypothetical protein
VFKIAHFAHSMYGMRLHMTLEPEAWWLERIADVGQVTEMVGKETVRGRYLVGEFWA